MGSSNPTNYAQGSFPNLPGANPQWFNSEFTKIKKSFNSIVGPQKAGAVLMGPASGGNAPPTYRPLATSDLPTGVGLLSANNTWTGTNTFATASYSGSATAANGGGWVVWDRNGTGNKSEFYRQGSNTYLWDDVAGNVLGYDTTGKVTTWNTLTVNANIVANQIMNTGFIMPGVAGVIGTDVSTNDDSAAIQAILNAYYQIVWAAGTYWIKSRLTVNINGRYPRIQGVGLGTVIKAASTIVGGAAITITPSSGNPSVDFRISGLFILNQTAGSGPSYGLSVIGNNTGGANAFFGGNTKSLIADVVCSGFNINFLQQACRMIVWDRCASWPTDSVGTTTSNETGWYMLPGWNGGFVGDTDLVACQTVSSNSASSRGIVITDQSIANALQPNCIGGIGIIRHTHYYGPIGLVISVASAGNIASDFWVTGRSQFEGAASPAGTMIDVAASASGAKVINLNVDYVYGVGNGWQTHLLGQATNGGQFEGWSFTNNRLSFNGTNSAVNVSADATSDVRGLVVNGNRFYSPGAGATPIITTSDVIQVTTNNNLVEGVGGVRTYFIQFNGTTHVGALVAQGNNGGLLITTCVQNNTGAASTAIGNNYPSP